MKPTSELPDDPALPALAAIRSAGLAAAVASLGLTGHSGIVLRGYTPGSRATLEARAGNRRVALKAYADDPTPEAELYEALAAELGADSGVRVPPLLATDPALRLLVIGWLEGPTADQLLKDGRGTRAGELAARWVRRAASLALPLGPPWGAAHMLYNAGQGVAQLAAADPELGAAARRLAGMLSRAVPKEATSRLVHGTLYARHVLDLGDAAGVIDWERFGQGPLELDAGIFLATLWRYGFDHESCAGEAVRAEEAFLNATAGLLDEHVVAWHRAAALLRLAAKVHVVARRKVNWLDRARAMLAEAMRLAARAARPERRARVPARGVGVNRAALELVLAALSTRPATAEELDQIRRLLDETQHHPS